MTNKTPLCRVEIFYIKKDFITFDFGDFAIVMEYKKKAFNVFFGNDDYRKFFMGSWSSKINNVNEEKINLCDFEEAKKICSAWQKVDYKTSCYLLSVFLRKNFPKHMKVFGI